MTGQQGAGIRPPTPRDVVAGLVTGLFSIPEGMAYANIGGFNPVVGLYAGIYPTIAGALLSRTVLMVTTLTSAIALTSHSVLADAGLDPSQPANLASLVVLVGIVMVAMGLLRLGWVMDFVSNAVMTGFTVGIALQIVVGVLGDATGYTPQAHNTIAKLVDSLAHVGSWDSATVGVSVATIVVWACFHGVPRVEKLATLLALVVVTGAVIILGTPVETVGDIASIPGALPLPVVPDVSVMPQLAVGAFAVALVALAQAAGIGAAIPNPDGTRTDVSRDFVAQGVANLAGGVTRALPTGGSLSRTGVAVSAGAMTRWAAVLAGVWLAVFVVLFGPLAEHVPMAVIGGLILVVGAELVLGRLPDVRLVLRTAPVSAFAMVITFLATTELPLQQAILLGAVLSLVLYAWQSSRLARLIRLVPTDAGWDTAETPATLPSNAVTVLHYAGVGLFAEVPRIDDSWPDFRGSHDSVLVLSIATMPDVPSTTVLKALGRIADSLEATGGRLVLAGVSPAFRQILERSGFAERLGPSGVVPATDHVFGAVGQAVADAERWLAARQQEPGATDPLPPATPPSSART